VPLCEVEGVELVERRGYLTLSLCLGRGEGRLLLRRTEGIREWFLLIQSCCRQSKVGKMKLIKQR
jgi:hypothetical protein